VDNHDIRGERLRALGGYADEFLETRRARLADGPGPGEAEVERLMTLGARLALDIGRWASLMDGLDTARAGAFDADRAADLVLETVFDETLTPDAWRALAAAVRLAQCPG